MLINKEHIKNAEDLARYESDITMLRQYELEHENPIKGRFGAAHLKNIIVKTTKEVFCNKISPLF